MAISILKSEDAAKQTKQWRKFCFELFTRRNFFIFNHGRIIIIIHMSATALAISSLFVYIQQCRYFPLVLPHSSLVFTFLAVQWIIPIQGTPTTTNKTTECHTEEQDHQPPCLIRDMTAEIASPRTPTRAGRTAWNGRSGDPDTFTIVRGRIATRRWARGRAALIVNP